MAQADRRFGQQVAVFTADGTALVGVLQNFEISIENETHEARALLDTWGYPVSFLGRWSGEGELVRDPVIDSTNKMMALARSRASVPVVVTAWTGGDSYSGQAIVERASHSIPEGAQTIRFRLVGQGAI